MDFIKRLLLTPGLILGATLLAAIASFAVVVFASALAIAGILLVAFFLVFVILASIKNLVKGGSIQESFEDAGVKLKQHIEDN